MEDIFTSLAPIYYYGKFFGNASYKPVGTVGYRVFQFDKTTWICSTVICTLNVINSLYKSYTDYIDGSSYDPDPTLSLINLIQLYIHAVLVVTILTVNTFYNKQHICLNQITQFDHELNTLGIFLDYKKVSRRMLKRISFDILTVFVLFVFTLVEFLDLYDIVDYFNYILERSTVMSMLIHFECWMHLIQDRFMAIHNHLLILIENDTLRKDQMHNSLAKISKLHQDLCCFARNINSKHSIQLFFIINLTFVMLLMDQYILWTYILMEDISDGLPRRAVYWIVCDWINLGILLSTCSKTSDSANDIKKVLNNIKIFNTDSIIKQETMLFSLQLLHNDLSISASDFFNVDYELMYDMISVVTTYMVILLQFRISSTRSKASTINTTTSNTMIFH